MKLQEKFMMNREVTLILEAEIITFERNLKENQRNEEKNPKPRLRKNCGKWMLNFSTVKKQFQK